MLGRSPNKPVMMSEEGGICKSEWFALKKNAARLSHGERLRHDVCT